MTGKDFNDVYKDTIFIKLTNKDENHNNFQFKDGLNINTVKFDPNGECRRGGLYFTDIKNAWMWIEYNPQIMKYMRHVTVPDDARVYVEKYKFKSDKIILDCRKDICKKVIKQNEYAMCYVPEYLKTIL